MKKNRKNKIITCAIDSMIIMTPERNTRAKCKMHLQPNQYLNLVLLRMRNKPIHYVVTDSTRRCEGVEYKINLTYTYEIKKKNDKRFPT